MSNKGRPSVNKRRKEEARRQRKMAKAERMAERKAERRERDDVVPGEDPDIAGIVPGPQPLPDEARDLEDARRAPAPGRREGPGT